MASSSGSYMCTRHHYTRIVPDRSAQSLCAQTKVTAPLLTSTASFFAVPVLTVVHDLQNNCNKDTMLAPALMHTVSTKSFFIRERFRNLKHCIPEDMNVRIIFSTIPNLSIHIYVSVQLCC